MNHYQVSCSEKVQNLEKALEKELLELKDGIEEADMLFGNWSKPISSVLLPKSIDYYKEERRITIAKVLDVSEGPPVKSQGHVMMKELDAALKSDITEQSLPLLLHQFFLDQIQSLIQCKHLHLLRWRRFCEHTAAIERLYPDYVKRLKAIDREYQDAKHRAHRLSSAHTSFISKDKKDMNCVESEDIAICLRWLVTSLHCIRKFSSFLRILQWIPVIHRSSIDPTLGTQLKAVGEVEVVGSSGFKAKSVWKNMVGGSEYLISGGSSISHQLSAKPGIAGAVEQAFSGFVSNEISLEIPPHTLELDEFRDHLEALATEYGIPIRTELTSSADEMELFGAVNRQFKRLFNIQEDCRTFFQYDCVAEGNEHWGVDSPAHCLVKPCNWTSHIQIIPHKDALQEKQFKTLQTINCLDELLVSQSRFLEVSDYSLVTESLKSHAVAVREPPAAQALQVTTHTKGRLKTSDVWMQIYNNVDLYQSFSGRGQGREGEGDGESVIGKATSRTSRKESYDYSNTMQMLGLDEGEDTASSDPTVIQGAYLSFLHLRHLKLRDMRRQCLSILNYFRSVERTITIYDSGLSMEDETQKTEEIKTPLLHQKGKGKRHASQKPQSNKSAGGRGKKRGVGSHHYINNTPADYKIEESEFMEFSGIINHDDFYHIEEEGKEDSNQDDNENQQHVTASATRGHCVPYVQDQRGYYIVYEHAIKDLEKLEKELLLVASHYISKDKDHRTCVRRSATERGHRWQEAAGEVDLSTYAHRDIDRFAVLFDVWMCELNFLDNKRKLLDCYLESYHNTFNPQERHEVAQAITDIISQRPRYDLKKDYFVHTYRMECACLRLKTTLTQQILVTSIKDDRQYLEILPTSNELYGMPLPISVKQPIAINLPKPALLHLHMFEFHPALGATASRLTEALRHALRELRQVHNPTGQIEVISIEKQLLELAIHEWAEMTELGSSFSPQLQKEVFSDVFCDDPSLLKDTVESLLASEVTETDVRTLAEKQKRAVEVWKTTLEAVLLRHRLKEAVWETEILSRLYKHTSSEMGFDEYHLHLRLAQFDFASLKEKADPPPSAALTLIPDDISADRFIPSHLVLAIQELDENMSKFSFHNKTALMKLLMKDNLLKNLRLTVACQVIHKNALIVAVSQAVFCMHWKVPKTSIQSDGKKESTQDVSETRSSHSLSSTHTQATTKSGSISPSGSSRAHLATSMYSSKLKFGFEKQKKASERHVTFLEGLLDEDEKHVCQEPFLSIQLLKAGPRDVVVNAFIRKKETSGMLLRKPGEMDNLKRQLITDFCKEFTFRMGLHAMRAQIIACYSSILSLLEDFPDTRDSYFLLGRPNEKKRKLDDVEGMIPDPRSLHRRPRRVLSSDGKNFLNLWFIPHFTEVLYACRNKDYATQHKILFCWLEIVSSLHDIIQCLHAHSRLGSSRKLIVEQAGFSVAADWGGMEGVGAELSEIQKQIDRLGVGGIPPGKDPFQVADFLKLRKDVMYMEFEEAVRHYIRNTFLATENMTAYRAVTEGMHFALPAISNVIQPSLFLFYLQVPEPLDPDETEAEDLYPWLSFEASNGAFPVMYRMQWRDVENCMQLCLASLDDIERQRANGEILGTSLLNQDVLQSGLIQLKSLHELPDAPVKGFINANPVGKAVSASRPGSAVVPHHPKSPIDDNEQTKEDEKTLKEGDITEAAKSLSKLQDPITSYRLVKAFLMLCKQLEILKADWGAKKLHVDRINTPDRLNDLRRVYSTEILLPILRTVARDMGQIDYYDDVISEDQQITPPPGAPEMTVRARQVVKLLETLECQMLSDVRRRVAKEISLVLSERSREETALPTDLWKKASIRETFTINRPNIVEDFLHGLMGDYTVQNGSITFSTEHLNSCVARLAGEVIKRERENYESYSMFYENLLRHHHHLLYQKELEVKALKSKPAKGAGDSQIQTQFQLADRSHELILEITALRSKITEMREQSLNKEQIIRQEVQKDYQELVQRLFEQCFQLKAKLNQYHMSLHENVRILISDTRKEAVDMLEKLRDKAPNSAAGERLRILNEKESQLRKAQHEKSVISMSLSKLHALNHWKRSTTDARNKIQVEKLSQELSKCKRELQMVQMVSVENKNLLAEELHGARKALEVADARLKQVHRAMEKEQRAQKEREYKELQNARNREHLAQAHQKNMDRMLLELEEKNKRLRLVMTENDKNAKLSQVNNNKAKRTMKQIQSQLVIDRNLKLEAFDRVDDLQTQIMDYEASFYNSNASVAQQSRTTSASSNRIKSALGIHSITRASPSFASVCTPPYTPRVRMRPMSCVPPNSVTYKETPIPKLSRPKTASGRLKSKIAEAVLAEMESSVDFHDTVVEKITSGRK